MPIKKVIGALCLIWNVSADDGLNTTPLNNNDNADQWILYIAIACGASICMLFGGTYVIVTFVSYKVQTQCVCIKVSLNISKTFVFSVTSLSPPEVGIGVLVVIDDISGN